MILRWPAVLTLWFPRFRIRLNVVAAVSLIGVGPSGETMAHRAACAWWVTYT